MPPNARRQRTIDVRRLMADGEHPIPVVMRLLESLHSGDSIVVVTPFLPSPLIATLQSDGYVARPERRRDGSWQTQLTRR
jgi:uncharacterized protein (DUF2249 family)